MESKTTLIPMTDYVISQSKNLPFVARFINCENYATKLKLPFKKGYFVPCDDDDNILEEPKIENYNEETNGYYNAVSIYSEAKTKVLFEGFEYDEKVNVIWNDEIYFELDYFNKNRITEQLIAFNLPLTPYGKQFFGL